MATYIKQSSLFQNIYLIKKKNKIIQLMNHQG